MIFEKDEVFVMPEVKGHIEDIDGEGKKGLLLVVDNASFGLQEEETLRKLVGAIGYDYTFDVFLWRYVTEQNISGGLMGVAFKDALLFGISPQQLGFFIESKLYTIHHFEKHRLLISESIREINAQPAKKQVLWNALKQMFLTK